MLDEFLRLRRFYNSIPHTRECDGTTTPEALLIEARYIVSDLTVNRQELKDRSFRWLADRVNVQMYEKVRGRAYLPAEKMQLAYEREAVRDCACPFHSSTTSTGQCILGQARPLACRVPRDQYADLAGNLALVLKKFGGASKPEWGFLPTLIAVELDRQQVIFLVEEGKVADAKLALDTNPEVKAVATQKI